jgi:tol-pal system-associated acyl-CoA thioesterase
MIGTAEAGLRAAFRWPVRVYWEDTDGSGVVYYANYLKYLERARTEWLRVQGVDQSTLAREARLAFVVRGLAVEFLRPARLDDALQIGIDAVRLGAAVVHMRQAVWRDEERLLHADVKLACVKLDSFPQFLRTSLAAPSASRPQIE